jgi:large subunit ribosomal protein L5
VKKKKEKMNRYKIYIKNVVNRDLYSKLQNQSPYNMPQLDSITLQISFLGKNKTPLNMRKVFLPAYIALELITGQKPKIVESKESVAELSVREGDCSAIYVTLKNSAMYSFLDSLVTLVLPSMGALDPLSEKSFDKQGNFSMKINNLLLFPQLEKEYHHFLMGNTAGDAKNNLTIPVEISFAIKGMKGNKAFSREASKLLVKSLQLPFASKLFPDVYIECLRV